MIHQETQLQMQLIDEENNEYFLSSQKMYQFVSIYNQKNSFGKLLFSDFYGHNKYTHLYTVHLIVSFIVGLYQTPHVTL